MVFEKVSSNCLPVVSVISGWLKSVESSIECPQRWNNLFIIFYSVNLQIISYSPGFSSVEALSSLHSDTFSSEEPSSEEPSSEEPSSDESASDEPASDVLPSEIFTSVAVSAGMLVSGIVVSGTFTPEMLVSGRLIFPLSFIMFSVQFPFSAVSIPQFSVYVSVPEVVSDTGILVPDSSASAAIFSATVFSAAEVSVAGVSDSSASSAPDLISSDSAAAAYGVSFSSLINILAASSTDSVPIGMILSDDAASVSADLVPVCIAIYGSTVEST